jgi:lipooligosaccharide transport system permease protein
VSYLAPTYDFFNYYFTLIMAPMFFFSGIFFPLAPLGRGVEYLAWAFPLSHQVNISRALFHGRFSMSLWGDLVWIGAFGTLSMWLVMNRLPRRYMT